MGERESKWKRNMKDMDRGVRECWRNMKDMDRGVRECWRNDVTKEEGARKAPGFEFVVVDDSVPGDEEVVLNVVT